MNKVEWVKQLTRENTLLDRSLRAIAYRDSIKEIGQASMSNVLLVGQGQVTSMYYLPSDYNKQQKIIINEFKGKRADEMGNQILEFLSEGYIWSKKLRNKKLNRRELVEYYQQFKKHHAHSRGAITYGYWGEPLITQKLRQALKVKVAGKNLDSTISILSSPRPVFGSLQALRHHSSEVERNKTKILKKLKLNKQASELVEILSWFTLLYELGELVSSYLYDQFLGQLKHSVGKKNFADLMWYDPFSLEYYLKGQDLSKAELAARQDFWVIEILNGKWKLFVGAQARKYYQSHIPQEKTIDNSVLRGTVASLGQARGKVKIVITQADQAKMNRGDILVSPMTTPRLMSAVKKAGAIVTDEGGLTAHAAIVSREFNIPCIVGTKVATKILNDGDLVEVDAQQGIVRKI
ncbi:MAG: PEP-utilizing enzyme [Patescibacteria group bacterium]|jgi:phosphoenolpyruvate synthase/pyruvate phosphate dikinase|nr:PEP-utilizing enzyme [Patescibacteria group bacterium]